MNMNNTNSTTITDTIATITNITTRATTAINASNDVITKANKNTKTSGSADFRMGLASVAALTALIGSSVSLITTTTITPVVAAGVSCAVVVCTNAAAEAVIDAKTAANDLMFAADEAKREVIAFASAADEAKQALINNINTETQRASTTVAEAKQSVISATENVFSSKT